MDTVTNITKEEIEDFNILLARKCLILNPYSRTLKLAKIEQTLENWYAILGSNLVDRFNDHNYTCLYADDIFDRLTGSMAGTKFKSWSRPVFGILMFIGPIDENGETLDLTAEGIAEVKALFETAKIQRFKLSS